MNEEKDTLLDNYFNGLLDAAAQENVLQRVKADKTFAEEFRLRQEMESFIAKEAKRKAFQAQLSGLNNTYFGNTTAPVMQPVYIRYKWAIAASIAALVAAVWYLSQPPVNLYATYSQHEPMHIAMRGTATTPTTALAENAFNSGNYALASDHISKLLQSTPDDLMLQLYYAICLIELQHEAEARAILEPIAQGASAWNSDARWSMALSYLAEKNKAECLKILSGIPADDFYAPKAAQLKKDLE